MNIKKEQIKEWFDDKRFPIKSEAMANLITQCFNELSPKWVSVDEVCVGSKWIHSLGEKYEVITMANKETTTDRYPVTVIYKNMSNGIIWSRSLSDWHRSMMPLPEPPK